MEHTASDHLREQLIAPSVVANKRPDPARQRLYAYAGLGATIGLMLLLIVLADRYVGRYQGRVYGGVAVAGVAVGGLDRDEAIARLDAAVAQWSATGGTARTKDGERSWTLDPAALGVDVDTAAATDAAFGYGRGSNAIGNFFAWFGALLPGGHQLTLPATLDDARLDETLRAWAPEATYDPTNAVFKVSADGKPTIIADVNGLGFDFDASRAALLDHAAHLVTEPVTLVQAAVPAPITAAMLRDMQPQVNAMVSQAFVASYGGQDWTIDQATLANAIAYRLQDGQLVLALDQARLRPFFDQINAALTQPGTSARLQANAKGIYTVVPGKQGVGVDEGATLAALTTTLANGGHELNLTLSPQDPPIVAADLEPVRARLERILGNPLIVRFEEYRRTFIRADIAPLITITEQPKGPEKVVLGIDQTALRALTQVIAEDLNQPMRNAEFRLVQGIVVDVVKSRDGREVQFAATDAALKAALLGATGGTSPAVSVVKPTTPSSLKATMQTPDLLGRGRTDYSSSIASRKHNVELAVGRLNGTLVAPGAKFSFNAAVGEQTVENGYEEAYGIALVPGAGGGAGETRTVSSIAGGICQVSTTLFHGVFRAGLPIEERNWHLLWVNYANSSTGARGLDATVDDQGGLDFQWWNNTGGWIGIGAYADGETVGVALYGTDPGWDVEVDDPVITNVTEPEPGPINERTHDLPVGTKLMIEHATAGFTASIHRTVIGPNGKLVVFNGTSMDRDFKSNYLPSRDRYQVGVPKSEPVD
jgi:vancomycin resistance protein YoaR